MTKLLAYLRLFRLPNVFTAMADVTMGVLFVGGSLEPLSIYLLLLSASSLLYTAGMVLNDVYDVEVDKVERPLRPLPSGQVPWRWARWLGYEMLLVGVAIAALAGVVYLGQPALAWRSGVVSAILAVLIVLYDTVLKKSWLGPLAMGSCRFFNVLLGMSLAEQANGSLLTLGYDIRELLVAGGIGVYIVGVTCFARSEATTSSRPVLVFAVVVMLSGLVLLGLHPHWRAPTEAAGSTTAFELILLVAGMLIARRCLLAIVNPIPSRVQAAVKHCILSLIVLDAAVCLAVKPNEPMWAIGLLALLIPTLLLGKWVYST